MKLLVGRFPLLCKPVHCLRINQSHVLLRTSCGSIRPIHRELMSGNEGNSQAQLQTTVFTIPNMLTMSRIVCTPFIGHYILTDNLVPALTLFGYSCITDFLDGYIARRFNMKSVAGTILDPIADKLLMIVSTISLSFAPGPQLIPMSIALLILGRDVSLGLSGLYFRYSSMKQKYRHITWSSYWDFFNYPSAEVKPTLISKYNTFFQMIYLGCGVLILIWKDTDEKDGKGLNNETKEQIMKYFTWMGYIVATTTVLSGGSYVFNKDAVRFLKK